ncbi:glycoside hydrolase family 32 protein [Bifidobacterium cuniculi]|uniref:beta-fructofuranosidase n=1 Tax=Bifidobacterium cuniculi TaxID=1688 RepID=A0A087ARR8_9BIFI|nr:GH32 C-terminal domain-containing protein [Bifidobacterium cuniculi]KFI61468.1 beta-(1-2)-fructofuranosidase [Bifidobacterium cuniculi]
MATTLTDPVPTPIADHDERLARAEAGVRALRATRNDRWYPHYHIASDGGWINDPNGLCRYDGRWHVFYQLHPFGTQWGPMHWGHVSSEDMVTWRREPIAMAPSLEQEKDGVFSGSAVIGDDGKPYFYYTGHRWANGRDNTGGDWQVQMLAEPTDGTLTRFTKRGMVIDCPTDEVDHHFRDPKVFKHEGTWYMTFGVSSREHRGQMWLYTSDDMVHWTFERVLFEHPDPDVYMLECPDFFPIVNPDGERKWVIGFSAQGARPHGFANRNRDNAGYLVGSWQPGNAFVPETDFRPWDYGHNFYAPQSFTVDGRQLMVGWMSPFVEPIDMQEDGWCGNLTLVREIVLGADNVLRTVPAAEQLGLRTSREDLGAVEVPTNQEVTVCEDAEAIELEMTIDLRHTTAERAGLHVHATPDGSCTAIVYDDQLQAVVIDRQAAVHGDKGYRVAPLGKDELEAAELRLRVFIDRGCVEVVVNDGREVLSSYSFPGEGPRAVRLVAESGSMAVPSLTVHRLAGNGLE